MRLGLRVFCDFTPTYPLAVGSRQLPSTHATVPWEVLQLHSRALRALGTIIASWYYFLKKPLIALTLTVKG